MAIAAYRVAKVIRNVMGKYEQVIDDEIKLKYD